MNVFRASAVQFREIPMEIPEENHLLSDDFNDVEFEDFVPEPLETMDFNEFALEQSEELEIFDVTCVDLFQTLFFAGVTRDVLNSVNKSLSNLFEVASCLVEKKFDNGLPSVQTCFRTFSELIRKQSSEFKRKTQIESSDFYVEPIPIVYGSKFTQIRKGNRPVHINKPLVMYTVPIEKTIKALFKSSVFRNSYNNDQHQCVRGLYEGFCCSKTCKSGTFSKLDQQNTLKIQLYCDGVNLADALKQNANDHRLGAMYFKVLNQTSNELSQLENIHLVGKQ